MLFLRWLLGLVGVTAGGGFLFLLILGNAFRQSLGASPKGMLFAVLPLMALCLLVAAVIAEAAMVLWLGVLYLGTWSVFYWVTAKGQESLGG